MWLYILYFVLSFIKPIGNIITEYLDTQRKSLENEIRSNKLNPLRVILSCMMQLRISNAIHHALMLNVEEN